MFKIINYFRMVKGLIKKIRLFFLTKSNTLFYIKELTSMLDSKIWDAVNELEKLEQDKTYVLYVDTDDVKDFQKQLNQVTARMRFSPPQILVMNKKLEKT